MVAHSTVGSVHLLPSTITTHYIITPPPTSIDNAEQEPRLADLEKKNPRERLTIGCAAAITVMRNGVEGEIRAIKTLRTIKGDCRLRRPHQEIMQISWLGLNVTQ